MTERNSSKNHLSHRQLKKKPKEGKKGQSGQRTGMMAMNAENYDHLITQDPKSDSLTINIFPAEPNHTEKKKDPRLTQTLDRPQHL